MRVLEFGKMPVRRYLAMKTPESPSADATLPTAKDGFHAQDGLLATPVCPHPEG